jgi:hypothetical protein
MTAQIPVTVVAIIVLFVIVFHSLADMMFISQYFTQFLAGIFNSKLIFDCDETTVKVKAAKKKNPFDLVFKNKSMSGKEDILVDPVTYDTHCFSKWGNRIIMWHYPGRVLAKSPIRMLSQQECLDIAKIVKPGEKDTNGRFAKPKYTLVGKYLMGKDIKDHNAKLDGPIEDIIEHNEYFSLLANANDSIAILLMNACGHGDNKELERLAKKHVILPVGVEENKRDLIVSDLVDEVKMVCNYCKQLTLRPRIIAFTEMMRACPDTTKSSVLYGKMSQDIKNEALADKGDGKEYLKWSVLGIAAVAMIMGIIILILINKG